ncbi:MAG: amino acid permease [Gemmatimonadetes bacterium]|nr:amino acid permease [Gemmatimonadota bacterium]
MSELRRELSLVDSTMINVGTMVGSAIFIVPATVALQVHASSLVILAWVVGGVVSLLGALSIAELGAAIPEAGGQYAYLSRAYGPLWGFLYGWSGFAVINTASIAAIAVGFATYVGFFTPLSPLGIKLVAIASIVGLTWINCLGLRLGANTQNALTLLKIGALAMLIVAAALLPGGATSNLDPVLRETPLPGLVGPFGLALVAILWAYDGWIEITYVGSEVKDPQRTIPRSIILSVGVVMALFVMTNLAYLYLLSPSRMAASPLVASDAAEVVIGTAGASVVAAAILVSTLGANNGIVLTAARIPYAMARDGLFFRWAQEVHPRFRTPVIALVAQGVLSVALTLTGTYDQLATYVVFVSWLFYAMSSGAVLRLRRTEPNLMRPYRTWGYPVTPLVFIGFAAWLVINTVFEAPREAAIGAGIVGLGVPVYLWFRHQAANQPGRA